MNNYFWIVLFGGLFSFIASMGIGANDVANSFATSIGAKSLTIKQAVILACIFETLGAILMGSHVSETIRKGIADYKCFENDPYSLAYGNMWVCFSVASWLFTASYFELPVSTTHSCIGGMIGMTIAIKGSDCVIWYKTKDTFPYVGGVSGMIISWFVSPLLSGIISSCLYYITRLLILRKKYEDKYIYYAFPLLISTTILLNSFFIFYKGAKGLGLHKISLDIILSISFGLAILSGLISLPILPKIYKRIQNKFNNNDLIDNDNHNDNDNDNENNVEIQVINNNIENNEITIFDKKNIFKNIDINKFDKIEDDQIEIVNNIHNNAEKYDDRTEEFFKSLQIFSAITAAFSHGANDVANAIGPFAAILTIYIEGDVRKNSVMDNNAYWILSIGGVGISIGLLLYGYRIMRAIGIKLCKITPSRGTIIELSAALVIIFGSRLKIPLSTTHCQVGATVGVGLLEDTNKCRGINCKVFYKTAIGWVITCIIVGLTSALLISQGAYAPTVYKNTCSNISSF